MTATLSPTLDDDLSLERAKMWRNLWFMKSGESSYGCLLFASMDAAEQSGRKIIADDMEYLHFGIDRGWIWEGRIIRFSEVSHFIPMPIGEGQ